MFEKSDSGTTNLSFMATLDGIEHEVPYQAGEVLLDCMLDAGLDPALPVNPVIGRRIGGL